MKLEDGKIYYYDVTRTGNVLIINVFANSSRTDFIKAYKQIEYDSHYQFLEYSNIERTVMVDLTIASKRVDGTLFKYIMERSDDSRGIDEFHYFLLTDFS